jgi:hypothetical protein
MKACLDPSIPVISPSLEVRLLTGLALSVALVNLIPTAEDVTDISPELLGIAASTSESSLPVAAPFVSGLGEKLSSFFEKIGLEDIGDIGLNLPFVDSIEGLDSFVQILLDLLRAF